MSPKSLLVSFVVAAAIRLSAAQPEGGILLKANSIVFEGQRTVATDQATLITKNGDTRVTADKIVYDQGNATFTLTGHVTIQAGGITLETNEATLNAAGQRVFQLSNGAITLGTGQAIDASAPAPQKLPLFAEPYPKTETQLAAPRGNEARGPR